MIDSGDFSFSFSGIKTAVRYRVQQFDELTPDLKKAIAREFEEAVVDVLVSKSRTACKQYHTDTLLVVGGVSANPWLRTQLTETHGNEHTFLAPTALTGDNALMIALAGYYRSQYAPALLLHDTSEVTAIGNLALSETVRITKDYRQS